MQLPNRPSNGLTVLDAYCCAGGMGMGYYLAGYEVVGIDIEPQPNYPFSFIQSDAVSYIRDSGAKYDLIHGSPPCQAYSPLNAYNHKTYPDLIQPTRDAMIAANRPYVIENVEAAKGLLYNPVMLCGEMFQLPIYRHRLFETSFSVQKLPHNEHRKKCSRNGYVPTDAKPYMTITGGKHSQAWLDAAKLAMNMPWVKTIREVCEAIPPAYAKYIGEAALKAIKG